MRKSSFIASIISWAPFGIFVAVLTSYIFTNFIGEHQGYWSLKSQTSSQARTIASYTDKLEFDAYKHYFVTNSFNKFLNFKLSSTFWNSIEDQDKKFKANSALQKSLAEVFASSSESVPMVGLFKKDFLITTIDNFINNLSENNITHGSFQINLNFTPQFEQEMNYKKELSTNQIIHIDDYSLKKDFAKKEKNQIEKVLSTPIPLTNEKYQYSGGTISIILKALDLNKGLYTGHIRYRRYFRANQLSTANIDLNSKKLSINYFKLKKIKGFENNYITVDLFKTLNLDNQKLNDNLEIHFGKLVSSERDDNKPFIRTGNFYLNGTYPTEQNLTQLEIKIDKLNYSLKSKRFTDQSKLLVSFRDKSNSPINNSSVKEIIKKSLAKEIISKLKLSQFHNELQGNKSK